MYPDDYDITLAMSAQHMKKAEKLMELGLYAEALPHVLFVSQKTCRQRRERCRMGKSLELLYQYETLQ